QTCTASGQESLKLRPPKQTAAAFHNQLRTGARCSSVRAMPVIVLTADQPPIPAKDIASARFPPELTANFTDALWAAQVPAQGSGQSRKAFSKRQAHHEHE